MDHKFLLKELSLTHHLQFCIYIALARFLLQEAHMHLEVLAQMFQQLRLHQWLDKEVIVVSNKICQFMEGSI